MNETGGPDQEGVKVIRLQKLTIYEVSDIQKELLGGGNEKVILDLAGVEECDAAGIQLLISLRNGRNRKEKAIRAAKFSENVCLSMRSLGIEPGTFFSPPGE